jgi:putative flippase GtrA
MLARTVSIGVQFSLLDKFVFYTKARLINFILFALYVYFMGTISALAQISAIENLHMPVLFAKIVIEGILFFVNFAFLRLYIFTRKK